MHPKETPTDHLRPPEPSGRTDNEPALRSFRNAEMRTASVVMMVWSIVFAQSQIILSEPCFSPMSRTWIKEGWGEILIQQQLHPSLVLRPASAGKLIDSGEIFLLEIRVLIEDLRLRHIGTQPAEDVPQGDA